MLLDRIDIDSHGPLNRVELGPFAEHLNVIYGPAGSGKTAISRFVRDSLCQRRYPIGMLSSSTGRVVWATTDGLVHCRREKDGTYEGRQTVEFESRGDHRLHFDSHSDSWINGIHDHRDSSRAFTTIQIPESIVDCVITDTTIIHVGRVVSACIRAGLDDHQVYQQMPIKEVSDAYGPYDRYDDSRSGAVSNDRRRQMRAALADVEAELNRLNGQLGASPTLVARRDAIVARLNQIDTRYERRRSYSTDAAGYRHLQTRLSSLNEQADRLRAHEQQLRYWLDDIDREAPLRHEVHSSSMPMDRASIETRLTPAKRRQLDDLSAQLIRMRRALAEIRGLQSLLSANPERYRTDASMDEIALRRRRLEGFAHAIDRYDHRSGWDRFYGEAYQPVGAVDDIDLRVAAATRQIDWLLERYNLADATGSDWYRSLPSSLHYGDAATITETLRAIRNDLNLVRSSPVSVTTYPNQTQRWEELRHTDTWLMNAIEQLDRVRNSILSEAASSNHHVESYRRVWNHGGWNLERSERVAELERTRRELDHCLNEAAEVRRRMRYLPVVDSHEPHVREVAPSERDILLAELREIDRRMPDTGRLEFLGRRRAELIDALRTVRRIDPSSSILAQHASRWLVRLSAGRLSHIDWNFAPHHFDARVGQVRIAGRPENNCSAVDRSLAALAVRMAAGELLAQTGRAIPLIIETTAGMLCDFTQVHDESMYDATASALRQHSDDGRSNHPLAAALADYARGGRQIILLTNNEPLCREIGRVGGREFRLYGERVVHAHRPLWHPKESREHYAGPYRFSAQRDEDIPNRVNRDFDVAWREAYDIHDSYGVAPSRVYEQTARTDWARDGVDPRDGYFYTDVYTTARPSASVEWRERHVSRDGAHSAPRRVTDALENTSLIKGHQEAAQPPFFLTVDSPVDQAPSIDAIAAARLRGMNVTHITHLMQFDANRLADALGLANVDASTVRRWQSECRLVCRVPQMRGFDARILVGCNITDPVQLAAIHPNDLLVRVQSFLATERGQQILLSGTSYELSRITRWIASAGNSVAGGARGMVVDGKRVNARLLRDADDFDNERYEYDPALDAERTSKSRLRRIIRTHHPDGRVTVTHDDDMDGKRSNSSIGNRVSRTTTETTPSAKANQNRQAMFEVRDRAYRTARKRESNGSQERQVSRSSASDASRRTSSTASNSSRSTRFGSQVARGDRAPRQDRPASREYDERESGIKTRERTSQDERSVDHSASSLRFYLHRESPVVDAPSIGARMAERLNALDIFTVDDLLQADPSSLASRLGNHRIDAAIIRAWQQQSTLVCRVPMLRGHDAQILVAAGITEPERLAECEPNWLLSQVEPISQSREGKQILRGGTIPDLSEVTNWIRFATQNRQLVAA